MSNRVNAPRNLTPAERNELNKKLSDLNAMLSEPEDGPQLVEAVRHLLKQYGQLR